MFGVGVLVYSIVVVSYDGFMLSSVKSEFVLSDLLCRNLGMVNGCLGGGGSLGVMRNHSLPE